MLMAHISNIKARPYLTEFLEKCFDVTDKVSIWTAASKEWFDINLYWGKM